MTVKQEDNRNKMGLPYKNDKQWTNPGIQSTSHHKWIHPTV